MNSVSAAPIDNSVEVTQGVYGVKEIELDQWASRLHFSRKHGSWSKYIIDFTEEMNPKHKKRVYGGEISLNDVGRVGPVIFVTNLTSYSGTIDINDGTEKQVKLSVIIFSSPDHAVFAILSGTINCTETAIIFNVDLLAETCQDYVEMLIALRTMKPQLIILLTSKNFRSDDFSMERSTIADVSLRQPIDEKRFRSAISAAITNNIMWRSRRFDLEDEISHLTSEPNEPK